MIAAFALCFSLQQTLDTLIDVAELASAWVGILVADANGKTIYERNADLRFMPASNTKLFSAAFAFDKLGSNYASTTRFWKEPKGLYIESMGDPSLQSSDWLAIRRKFGAPKHGVVFVKQAYRPGVNVQWELDDVPFRYGASITSLTVDSNAFELWAANGRVEPLAKEIGVKVITRKSAGSPKVVYDIVRRQVLVTGTLPSVRTRLERLALPHPEETIGRILGREFVSTSVVPRRKPDFILASPTICKLAATSLIESDNNVAESLMFLATKGSAKDFDEASDQLQKFVEVQVGISKGGVRLKDGSGVSRHNLVTPRAIVSFLHWCQRQPWAKDFEGALARPGIGTLKGRLAGTAFIGKTGTSDTNSNLSGYIAKPDKAPVTVAILMNHALSETSHLHRIQDQIIQEIEKWADIGTKSVIPMTREGSLTVPFLGSTPWNWLSRPSLDRSAAFTRQDR